MKKFAFYLPQFHEIPENNIWWGEGFTEWTNVKKAVPLFDGHVQPKHPLNNNYYNLLDKETVEWQTSLLHQYHVDGLVYYHYYFKGKKLLEKPAENLLRWTDINQQFFFCWANHDWNRSWNGSRELLLKQEYGDESDWEEHFQYLLPFFKDERYEKKDNKPLFMIYEPVFHCKNQMMDYFNKRCLEEGFSGIYIFETFNKGLRWPLDYFHLLLRKSKYTEGIFLREYSVGWFLSHSLIERIKLIISNKNSQSSLQVMEANKIYDSIIKNEPINKKIVHSIFFEWDNTPRHGERGSVILPPTKTKFFELMDHFKYEEYLFINAWNEWAEGMMLEPTEENGFKYLEWIKEWTEKDAK